MARDPNSSNRIVDEKIQRRPEEDRVRTWEIGEVRQGEAGVEFV